MQTNSLAGYFMKDFITTTIIILIYSCHSGDLRIPSHPAIEEPISPFWMDGDTTRIDITQYFPDPSRIEKITGSDNIDVLYDVNIPYLYLVPEEDISPLGNLRFRYEGFNYDVPLLTQTKEQENSPLIFTDQINQDTIYLRSNCPIETWSVYLHNYKLPDKYLFPEEQRLGIVLPPETTQLSHSTLRIWANNASGVSNGVYIPLRGKQVIENICISDSMSGQAAGVQAESFNPIGSDTITNGTALRIFTRQYESLIRLHQLITENQKIFGSQHQSRVLVNERGIIPGFQVSDSSSYNKLLQLWAFHITAPGIPQIYPADSLILSKYDTGDRSLTRKQIAQLNTLYKNHISLIIGDFIPLRIESNIYAYMRSYFGQEVIVVFNKEAEAITLKLDLPDIKRDHNFKSLFDNRFSYDNSKLILDIPAHGVEVIYNSPPM